MAIHHGDLFDVLPTLPAQSIHACVTDPPYGIGFMGKKWDTFKPGVAETRIVEAQKHRRRIRLPKRTDDIEVLRAEGFRVRRITPYQFRIDEALDLYPIHRRWHDLKANKRGTYQTPMQIAMRLLRVSGQ